MLYWFMNFSTRASTSPMPSSLKLIEDRRIVLNKIEVT